MLAILYPWFKVIHLLAVIAWMAGMMYLPRLFIYHFGAEVGSDKAQTFKIMERRLAKGIMTPAMIVTWVMAILLMMANPTVFSSGWFYVKLVSVIAMTGVHGFYGASLKKFADDTYPKTEKFWRFMNEVPFIILAIILIMVLVKPF